MDPANFLAQLWGFFLIMVCLSFLVKPQHLKTIFSALEQQTTLLFLGLFDLALGIASLLTYHSWSQNWRIIITIVSWLIVVKGIWYLFMPEMTAKMLEKGKKSYLQWSPIVLVAGVLFGCVLVYLGISFI